jgi:hypothetical protein
MRHYRSCDRVRSKLLAPGLVSTALLVGTSVWAQDGAANKAAAEALYQQGQELMTQAKYDEACEKFRSSQQLDAGLGTLLHLADCYEQLGRTASAWATFEEAASIAASRGETNRYEIARARATALKPQLSYVVIRSKEPLPKGAVVQRDGSPLPQALWGVPVPNDPGEVTVRVLAEGYVTKEVKVIVAKATVDPIEVTLPGLEPIQTPSADTPELASPALAPPPVRATDGAFDHRASNLPTWGLVVGGAGVVALGVSLIFTIMGNADHEASLNDCSDSNENSCGPTGVQRRNDALTKLGVATGLGIGGAVALGAGVLLYVSAPDEHATPAAIGVGYQGVW